MAPIAALGASLPVVVGIARRRPGRPGDRDRPGKRPCGLGRRLLGSERQPTRARGPGHGGAGRGGSDRRRHDPAPDRRLEQGRRLVDYRRDPGRRRRRRPAAARRLRDHATWPRILRRRSPAPAARRRRDDRRGRDLRRRRRHRLRERDPLGRAQRRRRARLALPGDDDRPRLPHPPRTPSDHPAGGGRHSPAWGSSCSAPAPRKTAARLSRSASSSASASSSGSPRCRPAARR